MTVMTAIMGAMLVLTVVGPELRARGRQTQAL